MVDMSVLLVLVATFSRFNESKTSTLRLTSGLSGLSMPMFLLVFSLCRKRRCTENEILDDKHELKEGKTEEIVGRIDDVWATYGTQGSVTCSNLDYYMGSSLGQYGKVSV